MCCHITGKWSVAEKIVVVKKHVRKSKILFQRGLDKLQEILLNLSEKHRDFTENIKLFFKSLIFQRVIK